MFKKLKEKITEEVKSSPQRFQQLTQSVSDRLQNSATSDENFFSIGEDDGNASSTNTEAGFTNVSLMSPQETRPRRNSSSSVASDVSFLPRYESFASMYHLQSDLEVSASELEDNVSTSSQLGHLGKEQIYAAFQKAQMRYHKYRGRYTDLAKHYQELERENNKMKSVLVETQDKAIRRVTELKEQCVLEQKAKAHLESALRDEIDEKQFKIQSLQTKIELLQSGPSSSQGADNSETLKKDHVDARQEIDSLNQRLQEMKANSIIFQSKEREYKSKIAALEKDVSSFTEREKENNLSLAQNKMELHNELLSKDNEISSLRQDNENLKKSLEALNSGSGRLENLQTQNKKLIEKLEALTKKCNGYESELLKVEQLKIELQNSNQSNDDLKNRLREAESNLIDVQEDAKQSLLNLETKIHAKLEKEFEYKQERLKNEFKTKFEEVSSNANNLQNIQLSLLQKDEEIAKLREVNDGLVEELAEKIAKYDELESSHLELIEECTGLRSSISELQKELSKLQNENQASNLKIRNLQENTAILEQQIERCKKVEDELQNENSVLNQKLLTIEEQNEAMKATEVETLNDGMRNFEEATNLRQSLDEEIKRNEELTDVNTKLNNEIERLKATVEEQKTTLKCEFEADKSKLLEKLEKSENTVKELEESSTLLNEELRKLATENAEVISLHASSVQEKEQLVANLSLSENQLRNIIEINNKLKEELKNIESEKENLHQRIYNLDSEFTRIEETNKDLLSKLNVLGEEKTNLGLDLERERKNNNTNLKFIEEKNSHLEETNHKLNLQLNELKTQETNQKQLLEEKDASIEQLQKNMNELKANFDRVSDLLRHHDDEMIRIKEETLLKLKQQIEEFNTEKTLIQEEKSHLLEEITLLKKLLEETNNNLTLKERQMKKIEEDNSEARSQVEKQFSSKINNYECSLKDKEQQIDALSSKLEEYADLIEERNAGFHDFLKNSLGESINNFRRVKNKKKLQNVEDRLHNFEQSFCCEKENLSKILHCLKQFEEKHSTVLTENDRLNKENAGLLTEMNELRDQIREVNRTQTSLKEIEKELIRLKEENGYLVESEEKMKQNLIELESRNNQVASDSSFLSEENNALMSEIEELKLKNEEMGRKYDDSQTTVDRLKEEILQLEYKLNEASNSSTLSQMAKLERELNELQHEKRLLREEIQELKTAPLNLHNSSENNNADAKEENYKKEIENLRTKVVQYKSLDLTNRSSIEFYENELQKLKNQNEKLNRKLDETLVTLGHCSELSSSTEIEYLRNVLYNYMLGKESLILARVIAAVCKFDPHQTELILAKEQQKQTLLGQLGIL